MEKKPVKRQIRGNKRLVRPASLDWTKWVRDKPYSVT